MWSESTRHVCIALIVNSAVFWERSDLNLDQEVISVPFSFPGATRLPLPVRQESPFRHSRETEWRVPYPDIMDRSQDLIAPRGPQTAFFENSQAGPQEKYPRPEKSQPATFQPQEVFPVPAQMIEGSMTLNSLILKSPNIGASLNTFPQTRAQVSPRGKSTRAGQSSTTDATITDVIQRALAGANISDLLISNQGADERSSLPDGKVFPRAAGSASPRTMTFRAIPAVGNYTEVQADPPKDAVAQKKAVEVLRNIRDLGYIVAKDPTQARKAQNPGSVASKKSENQVTCKQCGKFTGRPCELKCVLSSKSPHCE